jgi:cyanophycin synthetase
MSAPPEAAPAAAVEVGTRIRGHVAGLRQYVRRLALTLAPPDSYDIDAARRALAETFLIETEAEPAPEQLARPGLPLPAAGLLATTCALARHLLQTCGLPVFERERVVSVAAAPDRPGTSRIDLLVPTLEHTPRALYAEAYGRALDIAAVFARPPEAREGLATLVDALEEELVKPARAATGRGLSTYYLFREVFDRGVPFAHLSNGIYQIGTGARARLLHRSATDRDGAIGATLAADKTRTAEILAAAGAPVPASTRVRSAEEACIAAARLGYPVVVKPADRERGEGVALDLEGPDAVTAAYAEAAELSGHILVQRRIPGHCQRLVVFQGRFVFGFTRFPPAVEGDGAATIAELVERRRAAEAAKASYLRGKPPPFDAAAHAMLAEQGYGPETVLEKDALALMRRGISIQTGGFNRIVTDDVHPENVALVERVARLFRLEAVGLDLITTDPARPWFETGAAITEVNFQPQIGDNTARAYLDGFFGAGGATIPVEAFVGGPRALEAGRARLAELQGAGTAAFLASHAESLGPGGAPVRTVGLDGLFARMQAALRDPAAEALIAVVQTDELLHLGLPVRPPFEVRVIDDDLRAVRSPEAPLEPRVRAALVRLLREG